MYASREDDDEKNQSKDIPNDSTEKIGDLSSSKCFVVPSVGIVSAHLASPRTSGLVMQTGKKTYSYC